MHGNDGLFPDLVLRSGGSFPSAGAFDFGGESLVFPASFLVLSLSFELSRGEIFLLAGFPLMFAALASASASESPVSTVVRKPRILRELRLLKSDFSGLDSFSGISDDRKPRILRELFLRRRDLSGVDSPSIFSLNPPVVRETRELSEAFRDMDLREFIRDRGLS